MKKFLKLAIVFLLFSNTALANIVDELTKLNNLYKEGAITEEEFGKAKDILFKSDSKEKKNQSTNNTKKNIKNETIKVKNFDEDLSKTFISLNEIDQIGSYKKISKFPEGLFKKTNMSSKALA